MQPLFDLDTVSLIAFGDQLLLRFEDTGMVVVQIRIDLPAELVPAGRQFFGLVPFVDRNRTLNVNLFGDTIGGNAGQNGRKACFVGACLTQKVSHAESVSFHRPNTF